MSGRSARTWGQRARGSIVLRCSGCGEPYASRRDGTPVAHPPGGPYCPGSRRLPVPVPADRCGCTWRTGGQTLTCALPPAHPDDDHVDPDTGARWTIRSPGPPNRQTTAA